MSEPKKVRTPVRIDFDPWRSDHLCEQCFDYHEGLSVSCNRVNIECGYTWQDLISAAFILLGVKQVSSVDEYDDGTDKLECRTEFPDGQVIKRLVEFSQYEPSQSGLAYLREVLQFAGFEPSFFVNGKERR